MPKKSAFGRILLLGFLTLLVLLVLGVLTVVIVHQNIRGNGLMKDEPGYNLRVISDSFHSGILLSNVRDLFRESLGPEYQAYDHVFYAFADRSWFLEGQQDWPRVFPTLFSPTEGIIERVLIRGDLDLNYLHFNQGELGIWSFMADKESLEQILSKIQQDWVEGSQPLRGYRRRGYRYAYYPAGQDYSLFLNCHHFSLAMLQEAGYPLSSDWSMFLDTSLRLAVDGLLSVH
jgi:hypothetical protein